MVRKYINCLCICFLFAAIPSLSYATSCAIHKCADFPKVTKIKGIEFPPTLLQKKNNQKGSRGTYYIYHFLPRSTVPSPYIVMLPTSGGINSGSAKTFMRYTKKLQDRGFGVIIVDIFYNTTVVKGTGSRGPLASMAALSSIEFVKQNFNQFSNGKFGVLGESRGAMTVLSLGSDTIRSNPLYQNVKYWFDAGVALYPSCGQQKLTMPVQIFIGELDEWVSAVGCKSWRDTDIAQVSSGLLDIHIYANAHHLFNRETQKQLSRSTEKDHDLAGRAVKYDERADKDSELKLLNFFSKQLF